MNAIHSLVADAVDLAEFGFILAIQAGWAAGLIAAAVLVVNLVCHRWLSAGQLGLLWAIVLLRLVIPVAPGSSWSLQQAAPFETFVATPRSDRTSADERRQRSRPAAYAARSRTLPLANIPRGAEDDARRRSVATGGPCPAHCVAAGCLWFHGLDAARLLAIRS